MFTDYMDEDYLKVVLRNLADDFIKSKYNDEITGDFNLQHKVELYLRGNKLNPKHARKIADELLSKQQNRINYSFD